MKSIFLLFSVRVAERSPNSKRAIHSVYRASLSCTFIKCVCVRACVCVCVCVCFLFGFDGGMWDLIVLISDHCLSFYFSLTDLINLS